MNLEIQRPLIQNCEHFKTNFLGLTDLKKKRKSGLTLAFDLKFWAHDPHLLKLD